MKDEEFMRMTLSLARKGVGTTSPNPMVGALIVKGQKIVGEGYHKKAGMPHAEVVALEAAGPAARGATLYVNLEPCCHQGRTPPCVGAIIKAGIKKVVVAMRDPNPLVLGKGIEQLKRAGIDVKVGLLEAEARQLNEAFVTVKEQNRPFILMKAATSLDGKIATKIGESRWISNEESRKYANKLRSTMDGVMVGINTVILDNPMLVPRMTKPKRYPVRIVLDSKLRIPLTCQLVKTADRFRTMIFALNDARTEKESRLKSMSVEVVRVGPGDNGRISLAEVCKGLVERDITSVLLEGGGELNSSLLKEGFVDKIVFFYAPKIIGGKEAPASVMGKGIAKISNAMPLERVQVRRFGQDILVEGYVKY
jgi:diaminohydroxyphosphoribosylaminopyrimidine deaminase/5-amino-6-(5-phosphoribosylamino)uracil reductase